VYTTIGGTMDEIIAVDIEAVIVEMNVGVD
jgi:hypothetical protein